MKPYDCDGPVQKFTSGRYVIVEWERRQQPFTIWRRHENGKWEVLSFKQTRPEAERVVQHGIRWDQHRR